MRLELLGHFIDFNIIDFFLHLFIFLSALDCHESRTVSPQSDVRQHKPGLYHAWDDSVAVQFNYEN